MMYEMIFGKVNEVVTLTKEDKKYLKSILKFRKLNKKEYLLEQGQIEENYYFVLSGCLRSSIIDNKGVEQVVQFSSPSWWLADNESLLLNQPSKFNIIAAVDSEILILSKEGKAESVKKIPKLDKYYHESLERSVIFLRNRLYEILSLSAEEKYRNFSAKFPELKNIIPQKHIASYIGVTPEFFSSMKKRMKE